MNVIFHRPKDVIAAIQNAFYEAFSRPHRMVQMVMLDDRSYSQSCRLTRDDEGNKVFSTSVETPGGVYSLECPLDGKYPVKLRSTQVVNGVRSESTYELSLDEFMSKHYQWPFAVLKDQLEKVLSHAQATAEKAADKPVQEQADAEKTASSQEETPTWQVIRITRHDQPTLRFEGIERARVTTEWRNGRCYYLTVFETKGGKWVALKEGVSLWPDEVVRSECKVFESVEQLPEFFGYCRAAKALYRQLGLEERFEEVVE